MAGGVLSWEEPPESERIPGPAAPEIDHEIAAWQLRQVPGRWGVLAVCDPALHRILDDIARRIRQGNPRFYRPARSFESNVRYRNGKIKLYVRAITDPDTN